jgi:alkylhydroperoxidase family enzyme
MAFISIIADSDASGRLAELYAAARARAGRVFGIVRLMSLDPTVLETSLALYQATTVSPRSPLPRWFRELIAVRVSTLNDCSY